MAGILQLRIRNIYLYSTERKARGIESANLENATITNICVNNVPNVGPFRVSLINLVVGGLKMWEYLLIVKQKLPDLLNYICCFYNISTRL